MTRVSDMERTPRVRRSAVAGLLGLAVGAAPFVAGAGVGAAAQTIAVTPRVVLIDPVNVGGGMPGAAKPVAIRNGGDAPLTVTALTIGGTNADQFELASPPSLPAVVSPGATLTVNVALDATSTGAKGAELTVASNAPGAAETKVNLRGLGQVHPDEPGSNEPSVQWIMDTFDIPVNVGDDNPADGFLDDIAPLLGDEVPIPMFEAAGPGPVTLEHMATFGKKGGASNPNVVTLGWYTGTDGSGKTLLFSVPDSQSQSLEGALTGPTSFTPTGQFGFYSVWHGFADREVFSIDALNTWEPTVAERHKVRVYPFRSPAGVDDPTAYVIAIEEVETTGTDYNDLVFVARNVRVPGADTDRPTILSRTPAAGATGVAVGADVAVGFSESMNPGSIGAASFTVAPTAGGSPVAGAISVNQDGTGFTLNPTADLAAGTSYTVTVTTVASDLVGNTLAANDTWTFTTAGTAGPGGNNNQNPGGNTNQNPGGNNNQNPGTGDGKPVGADRAFCARYPQASTVFARQLKAAKLAKAKAKTAGARRAADKRIAAITKKQRAANARYAAVNCKSVATELFCEAYPVSSKALAKQVAAARKARAKATTPAARAAAAKKIATLVKQQKQAVARRGASC